MFDDLRDLYQEVVLDHGRKPRHSGRLAVFDASASGDNPMCGDRVQVFVKYSPTGKIAQTSFEARGCAISVASADLMAETVIGQSPEQARDLFAAFRTEWRPAAACPNPAARWPNNWRGCGRWRECTNIHRG